MSNDTIPLRFQRSEIEQHADLSDDGRRRLGQVSHPVKLIEALQGEGNHRDACNALTLMLPHRQVVWWGCLAARLLPDLEARAADLAAVAGAERWVQSHADADAEAADALAEACDRARAPAWVATAAYWGGPSLAPRGQQAVPPAPYLPGRAIRVALLLLGLEPTLAGRCGYAEWLEIGAALMRGDNGQSIQTSLRARLFGR